MKLRQCASPRTVFLAPRGHTRDTPQLTRGPMPPAARSRSTIVPSPLLSSAVTRCAVGSCWRRRHLLTRLRLVTLLISRSVCAISRARA